MARREELFDEQRSLIELFFGKDTPRTVAADNASLPLAIYAESDAPHKQKRKKPKTQDDRILRRYKLPWKVERFFAWLQNFRRVATRFDYKAEIYLGLVHLGCIIILLRNYF